MKKIISLILALTMCFSAAALLASCAGESAYEIAVRNGFTGTEEEWIASLKGATGDKGDTGATGDKGDKGDAGEKGDAGAPGEKGDKGETGDKGDAGAAGSNGSAGSAGANGADALPIEIQTNETHIQWRYVGETEWKNLIALEELKGEKGDQGEAGKDGADGLVPEIREDGMWWIGDQPTGIVAGTTEGGATEVVSVTSLELTGLTPVDADEDGKIDYFETSVWGNWSADKAVKPMLKYTLSNGRGGTTELKPSMVKGTYNLSKGGTYKPTVTFLGFTQEIEIRVTSYSFQTEWTVLPTGSEAPQLVLETILPTGASSETEITPEMISGTVRFDEIGRYPVTITVEGMEPENFYIIVHPAVIYYENFNSITGTNNATILDQLGWKDNINGFVDGQPTSASRGSAGDSTHSFSPYWADTGISTNLSMLYMEDGMLKIDNSKENNKNGAWATFKLTEDGHMSAIHDAKKAYTIQYDVVFSEGCAERLFVSAMAGYVVEDSAPFINGYSSNVYYKGFVHNYLVHNKKWYSSMYIETGVKTWSGGNPAENDFWILKDVFGQTDMTTALLDKYITVKVQYTPIVSGTHHGYDVSTYIKQPGGDFVLISKSDWLYKRSGYFYAQHESSANTDAICFVMGGFYMNSAAAAGALEPGKGSSTQGYHYAQNQIDGDKLKTNQSANGIIYLDNFVVFEGHGDMPEGFVGAFLPTDTGAELE